MLLHYLKVGIRNLLKYKVFSFINVAGLASALAVCMLIMLMLADQKSRDQFNVNRDRVYRLICNKPDFRNPYATTPSPLAAAVWTELPAVEATTHLVLGVGGDIRLTADAPCAVVHGSRLVRSAEARGYFADTSFFKVFSFELERGDAATALGEPRSLVISHALAVRLFGDVDPIGRTVEWVDRGLAILGGGDIAVPASWGKYTIMGVMADKHYRSHLVFDVLMSQASMPLLALDHKIEDRSKDWSLYTNSYTYALLRPGKGAADLDGGLKELVGRHYSGMADFSGFSIRGQALTRISPGIILGNDPTIALPMTAYYFLWGLGLLILALACLNYVNLSIARALHRAKEIGVRRVAGARRTSLVLQFLGESVITAVFALAVAGLLLLFLKGAFVRLWVNQYLNFQLRGSAGVFAAFVGFAVLVGVLAGLYPALRLSGMRAIPALKNNEGFLPGRLGMRKALSVVQFSFSLIAIVTVILIYNQFKYFLNFQYEFSSKNIVNVDMQSNDYRLGERDFAAIPGVTGVSACEYMPAETHSEGNSLRLVDGGDGKAQVSKDDYTRVVTLAADDHFLDNLGLKLLAGRGLRPADPGAARYIVVNDAFVHAFGFRSPASIVGHAFESPWSDSSLIVEGVVQDFHIRMILGNDKIDPLYLHSNTINYPYVNLRIATSNMRGLLAGLRKEWKQIDPVHELKYSVYSDELANQSQGIFDVVSILGVLAALAVIIALLGMLGMATYTTERRRKEVGIRKVLGASAAANAFLLSREFLFVLGISAAIAAPVSYIVNEMWLRHFPNRVGFGLGTVALGTAIMLVLGLGTIASQTIRVSRRNPVESLNVE